MRGTRRCFALGTAAVLAAGMAAASVAMPYAAADVTGWSAPVSVDPGASLFGVSCPTVTFCAAVDSNGDALTYLSGTWSAPVSVDPGVGGLNWVSCGSPSFCVAVDSVGQAVIYNGTSWSAPTHIDASRVLSAVSCASPTFCVAVDYSGNAVTWSGASWSSPATIDTGRQIVDDSCPSSSFCMAVDSTGHALTYNGTSWSAAADVDGTNDLFGVSCPASTFCSAVDTSGNALTDTNGTWSAPAFLAGLSGTPDVFCTGAAACVAVSGTNAFYLTSRGWSAASDIDSGGGLYAVSCPEARFCAAADTNGHALVYSVPGPGNSWSGGIQSPRPGSSWRAGTTLPISVTIRDANGTPLPGSLAASLSAHCQVTATASGAQHLARRCLRYNTATGDFTDLMRLGSRTGWLTLAVTLTYPSPDRAWARVLITRKSG